MLKQSARSVIRLRGVRHNNLKNFDLDLPLNQLIVVTGLSGSGKSSLAFDTLFAEGQRRYIETFSPYARQFFDRMDKPQVDCIEGIPPAIAIEQRNTVKTTRSTVGTMTEICEYVKTIWPHIAQLHCRQCGQPVREDSPQQIWQALLNQESRSPGQELLITFELRLAEKLSLTESLALVAKQGYQRLLIDGQIVRLDEVAGSFKQSAARRTSLIVVQDRLKLVLANRARLVEACEQAYHFGKGKLTIWEIQPPSLAVKPRCFSNRLHCAQCDIEYHEPSAALFSFNNPVGACSTCRGFGRVISIDYNLALPDRSKTLAQGVVKPWQTGQGAECQADLLRMCRHFGIDIHLPFEELPAKWQKFVIEGEPGYGKDEDHEWPRAWYGIKGYFRWLESRAYKMHVRVLLSRYRAYTPCPDCQGKRFQPEALLYRVMRHEPGDRSQGLESPLTLADFYQLPIRDAAQFVEGLTSGYAIKKNDPLELVLSEVRSRLRYLNEVGLGYLTLDRPTRSLSGGETERVNLTTCLGTRLVNTLFVLDEPSVGLHPRDTERLVRILQALRNAGNTVLVVEHEPEVMRAADQIVDLGPGHGATGGQIVFQGTYQRLLNCDESLTGKYLSGREQIEIPERRPTKLKRPERPLYAGRNLDEPSEPEFLHDTARPMPTVEEKCATLWLEHARRNNLKDLTVEIPLGRFVCISGVSGSGKTTLVREVLLPALNAELGFHAVEAKATDRLSGEADDEDEGLAAVPKQATFRGAHRLGKVVLVDQSILGKTPRSNPAVYIGAFDDIREVFAQSDLAKQRGLNASAFSFNSAQGQCERCRGAGYEKVEMQFLSDVFIRCPDCNGRRYRPHILEVKLGPKSGGKNARVERTREGISIADLLNSTVDEAIDFLSGFDESRPAKRAMESLKLLQEVGLGYLGVGQPINTLSGGESQRLKLVRHLAEACAGQSPGNGLNANHRFAADRRAQAVSNSRLSSSSLGSSRPAVAEQSKPTLFLFDEPTTGLHFDDVRLLLQVFQRLVDAGHSVLVIEHNLELIKCADWIIDLGPDAGDEGGEIVAQGTPEEIAAYPKSHTGRALERVLRQPSLAAIR